VHQSCGLKDISIQTLGLILHQMLFFNKEDKHVSINTSLVFMISRALSKMFKNGVNFKEYLEPVTFQRSHLMSKIFMMLFIMDLELWFNSITHIQLILNNHFQLGQTKQHALLPIHQWRVTLVLPTVSTGLISRQSVKPIKYGLELVKPSTVELLIASNLMDLSRELFHQMFHSVGMFKHATTCQCSSVTTQPHLVSDGKHTINTLGITIAERTSASHHNTTGYSNTLVE